MRDVMGCCRCAASFAGDDQSPRDAVTPPPAALLLLLLLLGPSRTVDRIRPENRPIRRPPFCRPRFSANLDVRGRDELFRHLVRYCFGVFLAPETSLEAALTISRLLKCTGLQFAQNAVIS